MNALIINCIPVRIGDPAARRNEIVLFCEGMEG